MILRQCVTCGASLRRNNTRGYCQKHTYLSPEARSWRKTYVSPGGIGHENTRDSHRRHDLAVRAKLAKIKLEHGCMDCGYRKDDCALDFDHRPGEIKLFSIGAHAAQKAWSLVEQEIKKCDVVCANCHRIRTRDRFRTNFPPPPSKVLIG